MDFLSTAAEAQARLAVYFPKVRTTASGQDYGEELTGMHNVSFLSSQH
jgi:hypothetical protein